LSMAMSPKGCALQMPCPDTIALNLAGFDLLQ
jgi:hypothetical protein